VSATTPALIAAAAGVGFGHAVLPDHWLPLAVIGRTRGYPVRRVARLSGVAGVAHVLVSLIAGAVVVAVGVQLRSAIESAEGAIVGGLLIATGIGFAALELTGHGHRHSHSHAHGEHQHHHDHDHRLATVMVPFGAAASPDLTILPVLLAAAAVGTVTAIVSLVVFAVATIVTIVALTLVACFAGYRIEGRWLDRWANALTAFVLVLVGLLVVTGLV
jgi:nickel/cobalt transporter (NicO) family protein